MRAKVQVGIIIKVLLATLVATVITTVVSSIIQTQNTMGHLQRMGMPIDLETRLSSMSADLFGMGPFLGGVLFVALAIGFLIAYVLMRSGVPLSPHFSYPLAGICAVVVTFILMEVALELTPISSARTSMGLILHGLAGFIGGRFFARMMTIKSTSRKIEAA